MCLAFVSFEVYSEENDQILSFFGRGHFVVMMEQTVFIRRFPVQLSMVESKKFTFTWGKLPCFMFFINALRVLWSMHISRWRDLWQKLCL